MKKEELLALQVTHFDFSNRYAPVVMIKHAGKKTRKDRKLKLPAEIIPVFEEYVKTHAISDSLFPYTRRFLELLLAQVKEDSGITKKMTASILRDTYAVRCLRRGETIETVLLKLGLTETTWEDAKIKYRKLASGPL